MPLQVNQFSLSLMATTTDPLQQAADQLRVISHPTRLRIIDFLQKNKQEASVTEIYQACKIPQAIASQHLITMKDRGLLSSNKIGTKIYYKISLPWVSKVLTLVQAVSNA